MIPEGIVIIEKEKQEPSLTFKIDSYKNRIAGTTVGLEAVKQAVFLVLSTERNYSQIYENYGVKTVDLIGQDFNFIVSEIKRRIQEALLEDERINEVSNFIFEQNGDGLTIKFDVKSNQGSFTAEGAYSV